MTAPTGADVQAAFCAVLCDEWARAGITDAVVAPGSRSTPMVAALDAEPRIRVSVVLDERGAGFTALGLGLATGRPAVVVTTSGTASVELHPAVVEAGQGMVPLIAVTTDRPPELHRVGAPQTVEQAALFGPAVRWAFDPGVADAGSAGMWRSLAARAFAEAVTSPAGPGPVHLNLPFREPLLGDPARFAAPAGREGGAPWHRIPLPDRAGAGRSSAAVDDELVDLLVSAAGRRGLIVAGHGAGETGAVLELAGRLGWPVLADPRSGCRVGHPCVVSTADALLRVPGFPAAPPEIVLRLGAPPTSKVLNQWLAGLPGGVPQVLADPWGRWADPDRTASHATPADARQLLDAIEGALRRSGSGSSSGSAEGWADGRAEGSADGRADGWAGHWAAAEAAARRAVDGLLAPGCALDLSEPAVAQAALAGAARAGGALVVSSSMPVRDVEWYGPPGPARVLANRGANGIDGMVATALGVAASGVPTVALLGDLAFLYDAGSLLGSATRPVRLTIVVVDNDGGGIFSFLPQASALPAERFERYWGTPHGLDLLAVARAYGVDAERVTSRSRLEELLASVAPGLRVVVVPSERPANVAAHDRIHDAVARSVAEVV